MDEAYLIARAQKKDVEAFNTLVLHYQDLAYRVAYRVLGDPESAADATQDAFINAYRKLHTFKGGYFKAWLMRIVTNRCYDVLKAAKRRPQTSLDEVVEENESSGLLRADSEHPEASQQQAEMLAAIQRCLDNLPDEQRLAAVLCDVEGYDYQTASAMMNVSLGTVKSRLSRARSKLRDCLRGVGELLPDKYRQQMG